MRPRPRPPSAPVRAVLRRQRDEARTREEARARLSLERAAREVQAAREAARRERGLDAYEDLVARGLAFDTAGGRPPPPDWREA